MRMQKALEQIRLSIVDFQRDESGVILPYVAMLLFVIIGFSLLALDGGRALSLQTQAQNAADALALAGGAELNRAPGSRAKATLAINNLVQNGVAGMGVERESGPGEMLSNIDAEGQIAAIGAKSRRAPSHY